MNKFTLVGGNRAISRNHIIEKVNMLCIASSVNTSERAIAYRCFHPRQSFQFSDRRSQVVKGMQQGETFEDLHDPGKSVEAEEDIEMYRIIP